MNNTNLNDELETEYDLRKMRVRKVGVGRASLTNHGVILDSDVAKDYPSSEAVNDALRLLSKITKQHQSELTHK